MLPIFIPSRSRWARSRTLEWLGPAPLRNRVVALVVPHEQRSQYEPLARKHSTRDGRVLVMSEPGVKGIAATRKLIGRMAETFGCDRFLMLDDDLRLFHRTSATDVKLLPNNTNDNVRMLADVERALDKYAHVGISPRQFNNAMKRHQNEYCVRIIRALAFRTREFNLCTHGRVDIMEDFDVTLQLLAKGYPNWQLIDWAQDQPKTQSAGGCSDYRTHDLHARNVRKVARLWGEELVQLVEKKNKYGGDFGIRLEAQFKWKQALGFYERKLI
jgi:hypothetical protein